jgi:catechol 2,3-dioxygenase-like lactoylglutathione lyase family enzyme
MKVVTHGDRMKILDFEHIQIAMPPEQEVAARAFYSGVLGLTEIAKPLELARRGGAWFQTGKVIIHLGVETDFRPNGKAHPAFLVDNLNGFLEICHSLGIETDATQPPITGFKRVHVFDPFGNRIELMEKH